MNPFDESQTIWRPAEYYWDHHNRITAEPLEETAEVPPAIAFVNALISLEMDDIEEEDRKCPICMQKHREGEEEEMPLQLPCGHSVGKYCLLIWLTSTAEEGACVHGGSCPQCRTKCIKEKRQRLDTDEGLRQLLRDTNYFLTAAGPLRLTTEGREQWEGVKEYVKSHLEEGQERMRQVGERFLMIMRLEVYRNPIFETIATTPEDLDELRGQMIAELEDLARRGIIAEYLEGDSDPAAEELEIQIARRLVAAPEVLQSVMRDVRDGRSDSSDSDGEFEDTDDEIGLPGHHATHTQLDMNLLRDYVGQTGRAIQYHDARRTYVIRRFQSVAESWGGDELLRCASCDTIHREGSYHWGAGIRDDEAEMGEPEASENFEDIAVEERMEVQLGQIMQAEHDELLRERSMRLE